MGIFTNLFAPKAQEKPSEKKEIVYLTGGLKFDLEIAQTENYQSSLEALFGPRVARGVKRFETARLILEDKNPQDVNAVRVDVRGKPVGYLNPQDAIQYRHQLITKGLPQANGQCKAAIRGGWISADGRQGDFEVWLDLPGW